MEPEGSLPHSKVSATCPYPEPARSSPYTYILLPEDPSQYYPPSYTCLSQVACLPTNTLYMPLLSPTCAPCPDRDMLQSVFLTYCSEMVVRSSSYEGHVFGTLRLLLRIVAHTVVCRLRDFGNGVQLTALPRGGILSD
jgi:hypothetical protein